MSLQSFCEYLRKIIFLHGRGILNFYMDTPHRWRTCKITPFISDLSLYFFAECSSYSKIITCHYWTLFYSPGLEMTSSKMTFRIYRRLRDSGWFPIVVLYGTPPPPPPLKHICRDWGGGCWGGGPFPGLLYDFLILNWFTANFMGYNYTLETA